LGASAAVDLAYFVDESLLGLGKVLASVRPDVVHPGHRLLPEIPIGTLDPDWIPIVSKRRLVVIIRDKRIRRKPAELALLHEHALRVFWITGKKDLNNWGYLERVIRHWKALELIVASRGPGPWFWGIDETRVSEIPFTRRRT
jgi:hypothetical protein